MSNGKIAAAASAAVIALAAPVVIYFEGTRYVPYRDIGGVLTVCEGDTYGVDPNHIYSPAECAARLKERLGQHDDGIRQCIKVPIEDHEHAAYLSFAYNVGVGAFCGSTLVKRLNAGDHAGACGELKRWTMAAGKVLAGLVKRRAAEFALCMGTIPSLGVKG